MVEYSYGLWATLHAWILWRRIQAINVGQTKISGLDFSILTDGELGGDWKLFTTQLHLYDARLAHPDLIYDNYNDRLDDLLQNFKMKD